ncbi:MFS transporter [Aphanizomenon flos-aquae NRERC-008]|jgi:predicted MFS family arabinose efflux permease|uniref:Multidrug transporter n=3 Tax=Aphanizomenon flos-aquae TaxID=1176 RepID=A0A1B7X5R3_APHFL|nr:MULTISPECIES: MFS transporter [Aphanizomenon]MBD1219379.1 MFS transporter [Aphanizomenon flos-aquae Clear-A1]MBO1045101.1 MFS transporter [Aphanizomenon flos-aquae UKL13-PB]MCE2906344.1 MFS transporter [Anabaena sp. CoA2_C59]MDJ0505387.1 MFS transporter [Nostocales cyanobacterium LE14-WE12]NTW19226.1 MFS transporter [Nostocales cyanobacterium W4_Combined_metabat2_030]OBQ19211.1 MAG: multidrug transporter [Aphanizomenon flos-aquae LD13]OBQ23594.1 MAG: multidrug transporter [Anabaena sp. WA
MNRVFWITALIAFINSLSLTILIPIIYLYGKQFGLNDFQTSLLFSIYSIAQFFATPVIGKLSDRFGRKPLLIISLAGTVIANTIAGTATTATLLFLARFLDGITGGNASVAQAVISDVTDQKNRAQAFGIYGAAMGLGFILGPAISLLAQQISLGTAFLVSAAVAMIAVLMTIFLLPETLKTKSPKATNIFDLGLENLIKGLAMPGIGILLLINFCTGLTFTMFTYAFQPYFIKVLDQNSRSLTLLFLIFGTLGVIMQTWGVSVLSRKFNVVKILFLGLCIRSLSFLLMPIWPNINYFIIVSILFALFNALVQPMISTLISLNAQPQDQGTALGLNASYLSISNGIGPVIAGMIVQQSKPITYSYPLYLAGVLTFLVLVLAVATRKKYSNAI